MRPIITVTAVVLLHLCVIAVLVGVNGCRSTSGFEAPGDNAAFSGGARPTTAPVAALPVAAAVPLPVPAKLTPVGAVGFGNKRTTVNGETLASVAKSENVTRADLAKVNKLALNAMLKPGQVLTIPLNSGTPTAPTKAATKAPTKAVSKPAATKSAPAAPAPTFTPLKLIPLTGPKPAEAAAATPEKK